MKLLALRTPCAMLAVGWALQRLAMWIIRTTGPGRQQHPPQVLRRLDSVTLSQSEARMVAPNLSTDSVTESPSSAVTQDGAVPGEPDNGSPPRHAVAPVGPGMPMVHTATDPRGADALRVETVKDGHVLRVALHGESDFSTIHELDHALRNIELDGARLVHLDLTHLAFADVATIRRLAAFAGYAKRTGPDVTTCGAYPTMRKVADLLHLQDDLGLN